METHLVTKYNEYTNDLVVIGIANSKLQAQILIDQDFNGKGIEQFRKVAGERSPYGMSFNDSGVTVHNTPKGTILRYTVTLIPSNALVQLSDF